MSSMTASPLKVYTSISFNTFYQYNTQLETYGKSQSRRTRVHSLHVHIRSEQCDFSIGISVRLETLKQALCIVEDGGTGIEGERAI